MRCLACNRLLSSFESTRKMDSEKGTGEYPDLCNKCLGTIKDDIGPVNERYDLLDHIDTSGLSDLLVDDNTDSRTSINEDTERTILAEEEEQSF